MRTGWRRMADGGWRMADGGWRMIKCGWKNADDKMRLKNANDTMQMIRSLWGKINFRCFLKGLFVNKPSHLIELRLGEVQYFMFNPKQFKTFKVSQIQKKSDKPWSNNNGLDFHRPTPFFLHYIEEGLSLSTIKQIPNAEKHRYN